MTVTIAGVGGDVPIAQANQLTIMTTVPIISLPIPSECGLHGDAFLPTWCDGCRQVIAGLKAAGLYVGAEDGREHGTPRKGI